MDFHSRSVLQMETSVSIFFLMQEGNSFSLDFRPLALHLQVFLLMRSLKNSNLCSKDDESNQFFSTDDSENYDLRLPASTATSTTRRYVMDHGGTSHALIILRIDKWSSGNGIVTYIDPYHYTRRGKSNRKYCLYSHLLNSMNRSNLMEKDANYKRYNFALVGYKQD